tara:strand:+ start:235 stop:453 length:219 start_codon:yes stop_codon:yes gene_type:complete
MKYVGYDFETKDGAILFDEELNVNAFLTLNGLSVGDTATIQVINERLVLVCADGVGQGLDSSKQIPLSFDES